MVLVHDIILPSPVDVCPCPRTAKYCYQLPCDCSTEEIVRASCRSCHSASYSCAAVLGFNSAAATLQTRVREIDNYPTIFYPYAISYIELNLTIILTHRFFLSIKTRIEKKCREIFRGAKKIILSTIFKPYAPSYRAQFSIYSIT